jgi:hypothetical protein
LAWQVLAVWTLSVALLTTNHLQYRLLEGYLPPISWFGWMRARQQRRFERIAKRRAIIREQWARARAEGREFPAEQRHESARLTERLLTECPTRRDATKPDEIIADGIMPTRFGNMIRAFEVYPREIYGADSIPVWLRLATVVSKDFAGEIEDARAQVNCLVNVFFLALGLGVFALGRIAAGTDWSRLCAEFAGLPADSWYDVTIALADLVVAWVAYRWATSLVAPWGDLVKSAFDCYLTALIKQLGYAVPPDAAQRRKFWSEFNAQVLYRQPIPTAWPSDGLPTPSRGHAAHGGSIAPP